jgi:hypothetical protein
LGGCLLRPDPPKHRRWDCESYFYIWRSRNIAVDALTKKCGFYKQFCYWFSGRTYHSNIAFECVSVRWWWMADGRVMKMLPKWRRAYTQGWDKRSEWVDAPGGQKITVTKYSAGPKKLWLVSHKMRFFRVSKVFWPTPVLDMWWKCCVLLRTAHPNHHPMAYGIGIYYPEWTVAIGGGILLLLFFLILNRIFLAEKCPFGRFPGFQPGTLWKYQNSNFLILKRIFLAEKSVNNEILGFPTGTLWKYQNSDFSNFEANIFGCELSVRI